VSTRASPPSSPSPPIGFASGRDSLLYLGVMASKVFVVGADAPITKRGAPHSGHLVVKSVTTNSTSGKLSSDWIVLPLAHGPKGSELGRLLCQPLPLSAADAARKAELEALGTLVKGIDRSLALKYLYVGTQLDALGRAPAAPARPTPASVRHALIGKLLKDAPFVTADGSVDIIDKAKVTAKEGTKFRVVEDAAPGRTTLMTEAAVRRFLVGAVPSAAPSGLAPPSSVVVVGCSAGFLAALRLLPISKMMPATGTAVSEDELIEVLGQTTFGASLSATLAVLPASHKSSILVATAKLVSDALDGKACGTLPANPAALGKAFEALISGAPVPAPAPTISLVSAPVLADRHPRVSAFSKLAVSEDSFERLRDAAMDICDPARAATLRLDPFTMNGALEQMLRKAEMTEASVGSLAPPASLSFGEMLSHVITWAPSATGHSSTSSTLDTASLIAAAIAAQQSAARGSADGHHYSSGSSLEQLDRTDLASAVCEVFKDAVRVGRLKAMRGAADASDWAELQRLFESESDPEVRLIFESPVEDFENTIASSCSKNELLMLQRIRGVKLERLRDDMFGEKAMPPMVDLALKKLISLRLSKMRPSDIIGIASHGPAAEPLAGFSKYGEAALANFLLYTRRTASGLSYIMPAKGSAASKFFNAADDKVKEMRAQGTSWDTLSHWWSSVLKQMEKPLKLRGVGSSTLNFDVTILNGISEHNKVLQTEANVDMVQAEVKSQVAAALGKRTNEPPGGPNGPGKKQKAAAAAAAKLQLQGSGDDTWKRLGNGSEKFKPLTREIPARQFPPDVFSAAQADMKKLFPEVDGKEPCVTWFITQGRCFNRTCAKHHEGVAGKCMPADSKRTGKELKKQGK
jgi:hypothetical protein